MAEVIRYVPMNVRFSLVFGFALIVACAPAPETAPPPAEPPAAESRARTAPPSEPTPPTPEGPNAEETLIIFLGDSLTAGYELAEAQAFPALVEAALVEAGHAVRAINAGISGDTTTGGLARLDWLLRQQPDILFVGLGGNDGLRGTPLETSESNLRTIVERATTAGVRVLLAGMLIPPNYGQDYTEQFAGIYPRLAEEFGVPLIPFLLEGVAADPELNLDDGIHPNAEGQRIVAETVLSHLEPLLGEISAEQGRADVQ